MLSQAITRFDKFNEKLSCPVLTAKTTPSKEEGEPFFLHRKTASDAGNTAPVFCKQGLVPTCQHYVSEKTEKVRPHRAQILKSLIRLQTEEKFFALTLQVFFLMC